MTDMWVGIDPGINGAVVLGDGPDYVNHWDMPTMVDGKRRSVDSFALVDLLKGIGSPLVGIEKLNPRPNGVISAYKMGAAMEAAKTAAYASGAVVKLLTPREWKGYWGFETGDKDTPRRWLLEHQFRDADWLRRIKDQDRADAYFIGWTARRQHGSGSDH